MKRAHVTSEFYDFRVVFEFQCILFFFNSEQFDEGSGPDIGPPECCAAMTIYFLSFFLSQSFGVYRWFFKSSRSFIQTQFLAGYIILMLLSYNMKYLAYKVVDLIQALFHNYYVPIPT